MQGARHWMVKDLTDFENLSNTSDISWMFNETTSDCIKLRGKYFTRCNSFRIKLTALNHCTAINLITFCYFFATIACIVSHHTFRVSTIDNCSADPFQSTRNYSRLNNMSLKTFSCISVLIFTSIKVPFDCFMSIENAYNVKTRP